MGEHAVVYGRPALVAAVDLRLSVHLTPGDPGGSPGVRLDLPGLPHREELPWEDVLAYARAVRESWAAYAESPGPEGFRKVRGDDPAHVVKAALGEAAEALGGNSLPPVQVRVASDLPIGSGFGSSAATAVGVIAAFLAWRGAGGAEMDTALVERLALEVERRQHGFPSGVDSATVLHGGILWARKLQTGALEIQRVEPRSFLLSRFRVHHTGMPPEPTGAVVAAVRDRRDRDPAGHERLLDRIEAATRGLLAELTGEAEEPARVIELIQDCEACLENLGVVPEPVRALVRRVEAEGGAAKISGAGSLAGPGAGSLLVYHPEPDRAAGWDFLGSHPYYPVHLGAEGLRRESLS
jgi:mevalonate kinase